MSRLAVRFFTLVALTDALGCQSSVPNIVGQRGDQGVYGFSFYGLREWLPQDHSMMAQSSATLEVQRCGLRFSGSLLSDQVCVDEPDRVAAVDSTVVTAGVVRRSVGMSVSVDLHGERAGRTDLQVFSGGRLMDSVAVTVEDAIHPRFDWMPTRLVPGLYGIHVDFDAGVRPFVGRFSDTIARASGSVRIFGGVVEGADPPSADVWFEIADGSGTLEVGTADRASLALATTSPTVIKAVVAAPPVAGWAAPGSVEVTAFDDAGPIEGATCTWTETSGLIGLSLDWKTRRLPTQRWDVWAKASGSYRARCQIEAAHADIALVVAEK